MKNWNDYFSSVPDPRRQSRLTKHLLSDILGLALCAMLCGADNFVEFALFSVQRQEFLMQSLGFVLPHGVPSHDTFTRVFARLKPDVLENCLREWLLEWLLEWQKADAKTAEADTPSKEDEPKPRRHLCIDGKVARGTWEAQTQRCALTTVSVFASEMRWVLCSGQVAATGGEKQLALALLQLLELEGAVITGDAAYCQSEVVSLIRQHQGDYVLALKTSHPTLYNRAQQAFAQRTPTEATLNQATLEEGHGRLETRNVDCLSVDELDWEEKLLQKWPGLQSVVRVERHREIKNGLKAGSKSQHVWFYLSSLPPDEVLLAQTIRNHWSIENQAHWVLDVVFDEDRCRTRRDHAPYNLALLRRIALNLLRQNQGKNSLKAMRKAVTWNQDLLCKILQTSVALL